MGLIFFHMQIIIFEGIASSGKTTLESLLAKKLTPSEIFSENVTLMDLIDNRDKDTALQHLRNVLAEIKSRDVDWIIIDRFHFTHAFRTGSNLQAFSKIESELKKIGKVSIVLLAVDEDHIRERIEETVERRKGKWKKGAKGSLEEKTTYYTDQQKRLLEFAKQTDLPLLAINTTAKDWEKYAEKIASSIK